MKAKARWALSGIVSGAAVLSLASAAYAQVNTQEIKAPASASSDRFGFSVATDKSGNAAVIGAPSTNPPTANDNGQAFIYTRAAKGWKEQAKLTPSKSYAQDLFGSAVAMNSAGNVAIVGAPGNAFAITQSCCLGEATGPGAAFIFTKKGNTWKQTAMLTGVSGTSFGFSVSVNPAGTEALVGAVGENGNEGAAYLFAKNKKGAWNLQQKLTDPGLSHTALPGDNFGFSVSLQNKVALVGADQANDNGAPAVGPGFADIYVKKGTKWSTKQQLTASPTGADGDSFGYAVSLDKAGNAALVSAPGARSYEGLAYVFSAGKKSWSQRQTLADPAGTSGDYFGNAVALDGNAKVAEIGAPDTQNYAGLADRYSGTVGKWKRPLTQSDSSNPSDYGFSVALATNGDVELVSATGEDNNSGYGVVYVYKFS